MGNSCSPGCRWWSLMASFVLSFFPLDVLDDIWDLIESVSEGFLTYSVLKVGSCPNNDKSVQYYFCPLLCSI